MTSGQKEHRMCTTKSYAKKHHDPAGERGSPHLPAFSVPTGSWRTKFRNKWPGAGLHHRDGALKSSTDIVSPPTHNNKWFSPSSGQHRTKVIWTLGWTSGWLFSYHGDKRAHRDSLCGSRKPGQVEELDRAGTCTRQAKVPGHKIWEGAVSQGHAMQLPTPNLHKGKSESCVHQGLILWGTGSHPGPALEVNGDSTSPLTSRKHSLHRLKGLPTGYSWEHGRLLCSSNLEGRTWEWAQILLEHRRHLQTGVNSNKKCTESSTLIFNKFPKEHMKSCP